jgi:hypothetical protein
MSQTLLYRISAVALVVGAVLVTAGNLLAPQGDARAAVESSLYAPLALVVLLGGLLVMAGWTAVYLRQRAESGVLGFVGLVAVLAAGILLTVGFPLIQVLIFPWIATMPVSTKTLSEGPASFTVFFAVAYMVVMAWSGIELFQSVGIGRVHASTEPTPAVGASRRVHAT